MKKPWVLSHPLSTQQRLWSDWMDAQADHSLDWKHRSFCWFCRAAAHLRFFLTSNWLSSCCNFSLTGNSFSSSMETFSCPLNSSYKLSSFCCLNMYRFSSWSRLPSSSLKTYFKNGWAMICYFLHHFSQYFISIRLSQIMTNLFVIWEQQKAHVSLHILAVCDQPLLISCCLDRIPIVTFNI